MMTMQNDDAVLLRDDADGVVTLTLNRPTQFNALSDELLDALQAALDSIATDKAVRVLVIGGAGKAFCAGHDLKEMRANPGKDYMQRLFKKCGKLMTTITQIPQPVIARVHGVATAAGCQLVAMCDLAVAADSARFAVSGINVGLFCSTPAVAMTRAMSRKAAMEMLLTGEFISAADAERRGLINRAVASDALDVEVARLVLAVCAKSSLAIGMGKLLFYRQIEMGIAGAYQLATETMACNMLSEDAANGIDAFMNKQKATWVGR